MWQSNYGRSAYGRPPANPQRMQAPLGHGPGTAPVPPRPRAPPPSAGPYYASSGSYPRARPPPPTTYGSSYQQPPSQPYTRPQGVPARPTETERDNPPYSYGQSDSSEVPYGVAPGYSRPGVPPRTAGIPPRGPGYAARAPETGRSYPTTGTGVSQSSLAQHSQRVYDSAVRDPYEYDDRAQGYDHSATDDYWGRESEDYQASELANEYGDIVSEPSLPWQYCDDCDLRFRDEKSYDQHCLGLLHKKRRQDNEEVRMRQEELKKKALAATSKAPPRSILKNRSANSSSSQETEPKVVSSQGNTYGGYDQGQSKPRTEQYRDDYRRDTRSGSRDPYGYDERQTDSPKDPYQRDHDLSAPRRGAGDSGGDVLGGGRTDSYEESKVLAGRLKIDTDCYPDDRRGRTDPYAARQDPKDDPYRSGSVETLEHPRRMDVGYPRHDPYGNDQTRGELPHDYRERSNDPYQSEYPNRKAPAREESHRGPYGRERSPAVRSHSSWDNSPSSHDAGRERSPFYPPPERDRPPLHPPQHSRETSRDRSPFYPPDSRDRPSSFHGSREASRDRSPLPSLPGLGDRDPYERDEQPGKGGYEDDYFQREERYDRYGLERKTEPLNRNEPVDRYGIHAKRHDRVRNEGKDRYEPMDNQEKRYGRQEYPESRDGRDASDQASKQPNYDDARLRQGDRDEYFEGIERKDSHKSDVENLPVDDYFTLPSGSTYSSQDESRTRKQSGGDDRNNLYDPWEQQPPSPTNMQASFWSRTQTSGGGIPGLDSATLPGLSPRAQPSDTADQGSHASELPGLDGWTAGPVQNWTSSSDKVSSVSDVETSKLMPDIAAHKKSVEAKSQVVYCKACDIYMVGIHNKEGHNQGKKHFKALLKELIKEELDPLTFSKEYINEKITSAPTSADFPSNFQSSLLTTFFNPSLPSSVMTQAEKATYKEFVCKSGEQSHYYCQVCSKSLYCLELWVPHIVGLKHAKRCQEILRQLGKDVFMRRYAMVPGPNPDILVALMKESSEVAESPKKAEKPASPAKSTAPQKSPQSAVPQSSPEIVPPESTPQNIPTISSASRPQKVTKASKVISMVPRTVSVRPSIHNTVPVRMTGTPKVPQATGAPLQVPVRAPNQIPLRLPQQDLVGYPVAHINQPRMLFPAAAQMTSGQKPSEPDPKPEVTKLTTASQPPKTTELLAAAAGIDMECLKKASEILSTAPWAKEDNQEVPSFDSWAENEDMAIISSAPWVQSENMAVPSTAPWDKDEEKAITSSAPWDKDEEEHITSSAPWVKGEEEPITASAPWVKGEEEPITSSAPWVKGEEGPITSSAPWARREEKSITSSAPWAQSEEKAITSSAPWAKSEEKGITSSAPWAQSEENAITSSAPWAKSEDQHILSSAPWSKGDSNFAKDEIKAATPQRIPERLRERAVSPDASPASDSMPAFMTGLGGTFSPYNPRHPAPRHKTTSGSQLTGPSKREMQALSVGRNKSPPRQMPPSQRFQIEGKPRKSEYNPSPGRTSHMDNKALLVGRNKSPPRQMSSDTKMSRSKSAAPVKQNLHDYKVKEKSSSTSSKQDIPKAQRKYNADLGKNDAQKSVAEKVDSRQSHSVAKKTEDKKAAPKVDSKEQRTDSKSDKKPTERGASDGGKAAGERELTYKELMERQRNLLGHGNPSQQSRTPIQTLETRKVVKQDVDYRNIRSDTDYRAPPSGDTDMRRFPPEQARKDEKRNITVSPAVKDVGGKDKDERGSVPGRVEGGDKSGVVQSKTLTKQGQQGSTPGPDAAQGGAEEEMSGKDPTEGSSKDDKDSMSSWQKDALLQILPENYDPCEIEQFYDNLVSAVEMLIKRFREAEKYTVEELMNILPVGEHQLIYSIQEMTGSTSTTVAARVTFVLRGMDQEIVKILGTADPKLIQSLVFNDPEGHGAIKNLFATLRGESDEGERPQQRNDNAYMHHNTRGRGQGNFRGRKRPYGYRGGYYGPPKRHR